MTHNIKHYFKKDDNFYLVLGLDRGRIRIDESKILNGEINKNKILNEGFFNTDGEYIELWFDIPDNFVNGDTFKFAQGLAEDTWANFRKNFRTHKRYLNFNSRSVEIIQVSDQFLVRNEDGEYETLRFSPEFTNYYISEKIDFNKGV